jgi:hypothetical protein
MRIPKLGAPGARVKASRPSRAGGPDGQRWTGKSFFDPNF